MPPVLAHPAFPAGDLAGTNAPEGAADMGPERGYTFTINPWDGDTLTFVPTGENALPDSLAPAGFPGNGRQVSGVTLTCCNKFSGRGAGAKRPRRLGLGRLTHPIQGFACYPAGCSGAGFSITKSSHREL